MPGATQANKQHTATHTPMKHSITAIVIFLFIFFAASFSAKAQGNYINVQLNTTLLYNCNTDACLEYGIILPNALTIKLKTQANSAQVYVHQNVTSYPSGWTPSLPNTSGSLEIDYKSTNSTNVTNLVTAATTVSAVDTRLFTQPKMSSSLSERTYTYDFNLKPTGYSYFSPGTYTFDLTFTMTQP